MRLIDADALIPNEVHTIIRRTATGEQIESVIYAENIDNAPTIDAVPVVHGYWKETQQPCGWTDIACATCSVCGEDFVLGEMCMDDIRWGFKYCPNCGAKMDGGKDDGT